VKILKQSVKQTVAAATTIAKIKTIFPMHKILQYQA